MNKFDTSHGNVGCRFGLEAEHGSYPAFDAAMSCSMVLSMYLLERMAMG